LWLAHHVESDNIRQATTFHVFHNDPQVTTNKITLDKVDHVLVLAVLHDHDLVDDKIFLRLLFQVHLLNSNASVGAALKGGKDSTGSTLTDLIQTPESLCRVFLVADVIESGDDFRALHTLPRTLSWPRCRACARVLGRLRDGSLAVNNGRK